MRSRQATSKPHSIAASGGLRREALAPPARVDRPADLDDGLALDLGRVEADLGDQRRRSNAPATTSGRRHPTRERSRSGSASRGRPLACAVRRARPASASGPPADRRTGERRRRGDAPGRAARPAAARSGRGGGARSGRPEVVLFLGRRPFPSAALSEKISSCASSAVSLWTERKASPSIRTADCAPASKTSSPTLNVTAPGDHEVDLLAAGMAVAVAATAAGAGRHRAPAEGDLLGPERLRVPAHLAEARRSRP